MVSDTQELPETGEIVIATVTKISDHGAYVTLDEYNKIQGFLHVAEIDPGWVRKVNKYVREGEKKVLLVKKVERGRKEIDLSLKQISKDQRKKKLLDVKRFEKEHGILKNIQVFGDQVDIDIVVTNPALQARKKLEVDIMKIIHDDIYEKAKININTKVELPKENDENEIDSPDRPKISSQAKKIKGVDSIIAISSAKGGVGKSTVTINLASALAKKGCKVGILDADIYGPSVPTMMDVEGYVPKSIKIDDKSKIEPVENYNVKIMSIGFFTKLDQAVVWRGPMASKALNQMIFDTHWGELDFLFLDLPPGTGDIHLSLVQSLPITGSIIVSTPQNVALADARRGIKMFQQDSISVPILGLIENMAYFKTDESETRHYILSLIHI